MNTSTSTSDSVPVPAPASDSASIIDSVSASQRSSAQMTDTPDSQSSEFSSQRTPVAAEESQRASANTARETITYTMLPALISGLLIALVLFTLNGMNSRIDTTNSRIDRLDEKMYRLDEKMDIKFEEVDRKFEEVDRKFEEVDRKIGEVDRKIEEVRGTLKTLLAVLEVQNEIPAGLNE